MDLCAIKYFLNTTAVTIAFVAAEPQFKPITAIYELAGLHVVQHCDVGTQGIQALGQIFIATADSIDVTESTDAIGSEHTDQQQAGWPQGGRAKNVGFGEAGRTVDINAMRVG